MSSSLDILPQPKLIEEFTRAEIEARMLATFQEEYLAETGLEFTDLTESSIVTRLIRSAALDEERRRVALNRRYRATFVYFADDENLATLLHDEGLGSIEGETKEQKQERIILQRVGSSSAGPKEWYIRKAIEVAPNAIERIGVDFPNLSSVRLSILANTDTGIPDIELVTAVADAINSPDVHPDDHIDIAVTGAEPVGVEIIASITLEPNTNVAVFNALESHFQEAFISRRDLGRDINWAWVSSVLFVPGVHKVTNIASNLPAIEPFQVAKLDGVTLTLDTGRAY